MWLISLMFYVLLDRYLFVICKRGTLLNVCLWIGVWLNVTVLVITYWCMQQLVAIKCSFNLFTIYIYCCSTLKFSVCYYNGWLKTCNYIYCLPDMQCTYLCAYSHMWAHKLLPALTFLGKMSCSYMEESNLCFPKQYMFRNSFTWK